MKLETFELLDTLINTNDVEPNKMKLFAKTIKSILKLELKDCYKMTKDYSWSDMKYLMKDNDKIIFTNSYFDKFELVGERLENN